MDVFLINYCNNFQLANNDIWINMVVWGALLFDKVIHNDLHASHVNNDLVCTMLM